LNPLPTGVEGETIEPRRGTVLWLTPLAAFRFRALDDHSDGRPWVIVQVDWLNQKSNYQKVLAAPTATLKIGDIPRNSTTSVFTKIIEPSFVNVAEIQCLEFQDIQRAQYVKHPKGFFAALDYALLNVFGVNAKT
jgi:hypothetical protein